MKALKISVEHGTIWVIETSDGKRAQGATLNSVIDKLMPLADREDRGDRLEAVIATEVGVRRLFAGIRDDGRDSGIVGRGRASA